MNALDFLQAHWLEALRLSGEHLMLVLISTVIAVAVGIPTGVLVTRRAALKRPVLAVANVLQTVPSLALFGFLIPLPFVGGIGAQTAIVALVVYALLPVIRNTVTGIEAVDPAVREAAVGMGMTSGQVLRQVELPLAVRMILAGVRVATVVSVGVATIAAAIGAGGLGTYIFRGLRMNDNRLILLGAVPAALIALLADFVLGKLEARLDPTHKQSHRAEGQQGIQWQRQMAAAAAVLLLFVVCGSYAVWRGRDMFSGVSREERIIIGSKDFTESILLGELVAQVLEAANITVDRRFELGGNLCHDALTAGRIDCYPEYTGTMLTAILRRPPDGNAQAVYNSVKQEYAARFNIEVSDSLGFRNDFAILVRGQEARELKLRTISDAAPHAQQWRAGFGQDFMSRPDGFAGWARSYNLKFAAAPREMDLSLTYRALAERQVDIIAGNSTDGLIAALDLVQLEDDRHYFPPYEAVILMRRDTLERAGPARAALSRLANSISTEEMRRLNYEVDGKHRDVGDVVREWRRSKGL